ncbi:hypothetical protein BDC45DRAFT_542576 [Circinella umbellata]|nr:hypothetical protein BDC45DRAFT_542576 [Circinella umbellata]
MGSKKHISDANGNIELALTRLKHRINARLVDLVEKFDEEAEVDSSNQATTIPSVLIDLPKTEVYSETKRKHILRKRQYSRELFIWLLKTYRTKANLLQLEDSQMESRFCHVQVLAKEVVSRCKDKHKLNEFVKWKKAESYHYEMYRELERDALSYIPLKACTRHWGARLILSKHWQNKQQVITKTREIAIQASNDEPSQNRSDNEANPSNELLFSHEANTSHHERYSSDIDLEDHIRIMDDYAKNMR